MKKDKLKRTYTFFDKIELAWFLIRTKLINKNIRLIRFPFILRGKQYIDFGKNLTTGYGCRFEVYPADEDSRVRLILGNDIQVNDFVHLSAIDNVQIGDNCLIASHVYISDNTHGVYGGGEKHSSPDIPPAYREYIAAPVKIGKNCWLGEGVIVLPGVSIGDGCVIGAHSVVNKDIPDASIVVGSPAKVVKQYDFKTSRWERVE